MIFVLYLHFSVHVTIFSKANELSTTISVIGLINTFPREEEKQIYGTYKFSLDYTVIMRAKSWCKDV